MVKIPLIHVKLQSVGSPLCQCKRLQSNDQVPDRGLQWQSSPCPRLLTTRPSLCLGMRLTSWLFPSAIKTWHSCNWKRFGGHWKLFLQWPLGLSCCRRKVERRLQTNQVRELVRRRRHSCLRRHWVGLTHAFSFPMRLESFWVRQGLPYLAWSYEKASPEQFYSDRPSKCYYDLLQENLPSPAERSARGITCALWINLTQP